MLRIALDPALEDRLVAAARRLKRAPEECATAAIRAFVEDCEEAAAHALRLGGDGVVRSEDGFED